MAIWIIAAALQAGSHGCLWWCRCIYSGSWDYTMRVWQRNSLQLAAIVPFDDWVFSLASRGGHVLAGLSSRFHVLDQCTLQPLKQLYHQVGCNFAVSMETQHGWTQHGSVVNNGTWQHASFVCMSSCAAGSWCHWLSCETGTLSEQLLVQRSITTGLWFVAMSRLMP